MNIDKMQALLHAYIMIDWQFKVDNVKVEGTFFNKTIKEEDWILEVWKKSPIEENLIKPLEFLLPTRNYELYKQEIFIDIAEKMNHNTSETILIERVFHYYYNLGFFSKVSYKAKLLDIKIYGDALIQVIENGIKHYSNIRKGF